MRDIRCDTTTNGPGHLLARVNGDKLEVYCVKCKTWHAVAVVDVVAWSMADIRNGHEPREDSKLLW